MTRRRFLVFLAVLLIVTPVAAFLVNLSWFDEPLLPEIEALRQSRPAAPEGNAYPLAMEFLAGLDATPGFHCQARHRLDCADRLVASIASVDLNQPRLALLGARYETLLQQPHYVEIPGPDFETPWPPLGSIVAAGRLRLAMSFRADPTTVFLEKASQDLAFWRMVMREGQLLGTKMVALAAIRNTHDFLSALLRARDLDAGELELLRAALRPFSRAESNIGMAFVSEMRAQVRGGVTPDTKGLPWWARGLVQRNASLNQLFVETIEPMRMRSSLGVREYYERKAYEPLRHEFSPTLRALYNLGGKLALSRSPWDPWQFPSRVHDEDGRIVLLLLQAQVEESPEQGVASVVRTSIHRNLYTGGAMEYDSRTRTMEFACLHTAFHPPEPADQCAVALGPAAD